MMGEKINQQTRRSVISQSILIVRLSAIGDIVMASPVIHALKKKYPDASIAWLVQPEALELLRDHPELDEVIVWPRKDWESLYRSKRFPALFREIVSFRKQLRARHFDLAIDLQGLLKSGFLTRLSGARNRVGLGSKEGSQHLMTRVIERGGEAGLIGSEYRYLAEQLALPTDDFRMQLAIGVEAETQLQIVRQKIDGPYLVICPFTTRPQKHWFNDAWIELAGLVQKQYQLKVVMLGGPGDREAAEEIASASQVINLVGETSLQVAAGLIRESALVVGVDTGLTHMGHAFARPTVCLFGSTRPYLKTGAANSRIIYHGLDCSPCKRRPSCNGAFTCMREITAAEVLAVTDELLDGHA